MSLKDGKLDVGLFGPSEMLGMEDAEGALQNLRSLLEEFVGEAEN